MLYQEYGRAVYSLALTLLRDAQAAQEVAQEVFLAIWHGARDFDPQRGSGRTWILSLAHHKSVDAVRRQRLRANWPLAADPVGATAPDISGEVMERIVGEHVRQTLQALSQEHREAIVLAYYGGYTQQEIANRLSIPLGTVKTRIRDGLIRLRSLLAITVGETDS
jgi:RNA polymerase sigma-70 factor (ECF subfamily)